MPAAAAQYAGGCLALIAALAIGGISESPRRSTSHAPPPVTLARPAIRAAAASVVAPVALSAISPRSVVSSVLATPVALDFGALQSTSWTPANLPFSAPTSTFEGDALHPAMSPGSLGYPAGASSASSEAQDVESEFEVVRNQQVFETAMPYVDASAAQWLGRRTGALDLAATIGAHASRGAHSPAGAAMAWLLADLENGSTFNLRLGANVLLLDDALAEAKHGYEPEAYVFAGFGFSY